MTEKEKKNYQKELKKIASSPKESLKVLHQAGILTSTGKLEKIYK